MLYEGPHLNGSFPLQVLPSAKATNIPRNQVPKDIPRCAIGYGEHGSHILVAFFHLDKRKEILWGAIQNYLPIMIDGGKAMFLGEVKKHRPGTIPM